MVGGLDRVRTFIVDADETARLDLLERFKKAGFSTVEGFANVQPLYDVAAEGDLDLVVIESQAGSDAAAKFLRALRHREIGDNPFPIAIATTVTASADHIRALIDAGYDDIVRKPVAFDSLMKRTLAFVEARKQFVVTTDYLGPDRRGGERKNEGMEIPLIDVPNPVSLIAKRNIDYDDLRSLASQSFVHLNDQKIRRHVDQIQWLTDRIQPKFLYETIDEECTAMLVKLHRVAEDLAKRVTGTEAEHLAEPAVDLVNVARRVAADPLEANPADVGQIPALSKTLQNSLNKRRRRV